MMRVRSLFLPICALVLATVGSAGAQEFRATIKGQVADTSGAAVNRTAAANSASFFMELLLLNRMNGFERG